jgi:hypothetical protein
MQCRGVLVHHCCRLSPAVAIRALEIHCVAAMLSENGILNAVPPFIGSVVWYSLFHLIPCLSLHPEPKDIER